MYWRLPLASEEHVAEDRDDPSLRDREVAVAEAGIRQRSERRNRRARVVVVRVDPRNATRCRLVAALLEDRELRRQGPHQEAHCSHDGVPAERIDLPLERLVEPPTTVLPLAIDSGSGGGAPCSAWRICASDSRRTPSLPTVCVRPTTTPATRPGYKGYDKASHVVWMIQTVLVDCALQRGCQSWEGSRRLLCEEREPRDTRSSAVPLSEVSRPFHWLNHVCGRPGRSTFARADRSESKPSPRSASVTTARSSPPRSPPEARPSRIRCRAEDSTTAPRCLRRVAPALLASPGLERLLSEEDRTGDDAAEPPPGGSLSGTLTVHSPPSAAHHRVDRHLSRRCAGAQRARRWRWSMTSGREDERVKR